MMAVFRPDPGLLRRQVSSIRQQTLPNWQCLIGIDGKDSSTRSLVEDLVAGDNRFRVVEYPANVGHYRNFERLSAEAPRDVGWFAYCDQDDYWYPHKLEELVALLDARPHCSAVVGAAQVVDRHGSVLGLSKRRSESIAELILKNQVTGSFSVFRPDVLHLALPFPGGTRAAVHDHWLGLCAFAVGEVVFCTEPLQDYVQHEANAIGEALRPKLGAYVGTVIARRGFAVELTRVTEELWGWRVSMSRTLLARLQGLDLLPLDSIRPVAKGRLNTALVKLLYRESVAGRLSPVDAFGFCVAASWWVCLSASTRSRIVG